MLSGGVNTFAWNARNQLKTVNGTSNFEYDGLGRRYQNNASTQFLYDGVDSVQELVSGTATANRITGGVDEFFSRADSTGTYYPLTDALGSTIALSNSSGSVVTNYGYDPFGNTSVSGNSNSNFFDYTGRENEGNGLYYYRARYYEPGLGRFIAQDPIGFQGGLNIYAYAYDSPMNFIDPLGLKGCLTPWQRVFVIGHAIGNIAIGLDKMKTAGALFTADVLSAGTTSELTVPGGFYLFINGGFNVLGGVEEGIGGITDVPSEAAAGNYLANVGTVTGFAAAMNGYRKIPNGASGCPGLTVLKNASEIGQWENLASSWALDPAIQAANAAEQSVLTQLYDNVMGGAEIMGTTQGQYGAPCACSCH